MIKLGNRDSVSVVITDYCKDNKKYPNHLFLLSLGGNLIVLSLTHQPIRAFYSSMIVFG